MSAPLRILIVSDVSPLVIRGGAERVLWELASRLAARGHRVRVLCRAPAGEEPMPLERDGVSVTHFPCARRSALSFLRGAVFAARRGLERLLAAEPCDVVHLYQPLSGFGALRPARVRGLPVLYSFLSPAPLEYASREGMSAHHRLGLVGRTAQAVLWGLERACLRRATAIHVLSEFSAGQLWRLYGMPSDRLVRIPGGVDLAKFTPVRDRRTVRSALGLPTDAPLLLTVRNLEARMGLDALIRAMAILRRQVPNVRLLIGGAGSLRTALESLVESLDLGNHIRFLGYVPDADLPRYYQAADAFVLPTRELEGFGLITVEAMACGTPVLGTAAGATPEILRPLDPSLVFRDATPECMAERLQAFLADRNREPEGGERMRRSCRRHVEGAYGWERAVERIERTLAGLAGSPLRDARPTASCPACGGMYRTTRLAYRGSSYLRCPRCGTGRVFALPSPVTLRTRYETEYPDRHAPDRVAAARAAMFSAVRDRVARLTSANHVLDIGCAGGHLLRSAPQRGWKPFGTDLSADACAATQAVGVPAVQAEAGALPYRDACMDVVFLLNLLDHTPDPFRVIREAHRVLTPGGLLVIRVPNAAFHRTGVRWLSALGLCARWRGWDRYPILHLFAFPAAGLRRLARRGGFHVLEVRNSWLAADGAAEQRLLRLVRFMIALGARSLEVLSRGRVLAGPSIELYARRPDSAPGGVR
jgi:glycosyltransferase involved in cell wall biosynthesis/SAM-dependent methyltransferase